MYSISNRRLFVYRAVRGADTELRVLSIQVHAQEMRSDLVELQAGSVSITVTASHRIMLRRGRELVSAAAGELREGDDVVCRNSGIQPLTRVQSLSASVAVVEIEFNPDRPIATFPRRRRASASS